MVDMHNSQLQGKLCHQQNIEKRQSHRLCCHESEWIRSQHLNLHRGLPGVGKNCAAAQELYVYSVSALTSVSPDACGMDSTRTVIPPSANTTTSLLPSPSRSVTNGRGTGRFAPPVERGRSPTILIDEGVSAHRENKQCGPR